MSSKHSRISSVVCACLLGAPVAHADPLPFVFENAEGDFNELSGQFELALEATDSFGDFVQSFVCIPPGGDECDAQTNASGVAGDTPNGVQFAHEAESDAGIADPMGGARIAAAVARVDFNPQDLISTRGASEDLVFAIRVTERAFINETILLPNESLRGFGGPDLEQFDLSGCVQSNFNGAISFVLDQPYFIVSETPESEFGGRPERVGGDSDERDDGVLSPGRYTMFVDAFAQASRDCENFTAPPSMDSERVYVLRLSLTPPGPGAARAVPLQFNPALLGTAIAGAGLLVLGRRAAASS